MGSSGQEEEAPGIFWAWVEGASGNMALALAALVEQVQSWAKGVGLGGLTLLPNMDTLGTLLVGWMVFVTLILILGTFFYFKFIHQLGNETHTEQDDTGPGEEGQSRASKGKGGTDAAGGTTPGRAKAAKRDEVARKPTIVPDHKPEPVSAPVGTGADPDAVKWTNNVFTWLYNSADGGQIVRKIWLETLNENTVKTAIETGILVEVVELMKQTPAPILSNVVVDCSPTDNVTITCDCDATLYLRIITTRTQGDQTTESEYACAVTPLHGRLNIAAVTAELLAVAKFDGWPEVSLKLEGIRNNATGLDEQQMLDVIDEVLTSALRNSVLEFNFQSNMTFPRFRRARQAPDPIIPVGYDSMVRERQTHPPSVPRKTPKADFVPLHDEKLEAAGESFTALTFSSNLTSSEEQLIARNLTKYPSLENAEMGPEEIEEFCKTWQENYVPATDVPPPHENATEEKPEPPPATNPTTTVGTHLEEEAEPKTQNFVLMVSNRSKLIDEPRNALLDDEEMGGMEEEEEAELADMMPSQRPVDEPCLRKESGSPLLLAAPKFNNLAEAEDDDLEDAKMRFDRLEILDKPQLGGTAGLGSLLKGPFVSEACCVGVQVGVAAQVPQLDLRIETAALGGSVACDHPEYDQEAPTQPPLLPLLHNQPSSATTLCLESGVDVDDLSSGSEEMPSSPSPIHSLSPEPFIPTASGVSNLVDDSSDENDVEERELLEPIGEDNSASSHQSSGVVACAELHSDSLPDRKDSEDAVSEDDDEDSCSEVTMLDQDVGYSSEETELDTDSLPDRKDSEEAVSEDKNQNFYSNVKMQIQNVEYPFEEDEGRTSPLDIIEVDFKYQNIENNSAYKDNLYLELTTDGDIVPAKQVYESESGEEKIGISITTDEDDHCKEMNTRVKTAADNEGSIVALDDETTNKSITGNGTDEDVNEETSEMAAENEDKRETINIALEDDDGYDVNDEGSITANEEDEDENEETSTMTEEDEDEIEKANLVPQEKDTNEQSKITVEEKKETKSHSAEPIIEIQEEEGNQSKLKKICLNEFTDSLFRHIEIEDSELSIPEECVEHLPWEVMDVYEPQHETQQDPESSLNASKIEASRDGDSNLEGPESLLPTLQGAKSSSPPQEPKSPLSPQEQESPSLSLQEHGSPPPQGHRSSLQEQTSYFSHQEHGSPSEVPTSSLQEQEAPSVSLQEHGSSTPEGSTSSLQGHETTPTPHEQDLLSSPLQEYHLPSLSLSQKVTASEDSEEHYGESGLMIDDGEPQLEEQCNGSHFRPGDEPASEEECDRTEQNIQNCEAENCMILSKENEDMASYYLHDQQGRGNCEVIQESAAVSKLEEEEDIQDIYPREGKSEDFEEDLHGRYHAARIVADDNASVMHDHCESSSLILDENGNGVSAEMAAESNGMTDLEVEASECTNVITIESPNDEDSKSVITETNDENSNGISTETEMNEDSTEINTEIKFASNVTSSEAEFDRCIEIGSNRSQVPDDKVSITFDRATNVVSIEYDKDTSNVGSTEVEVPNKVSNGSSIKTEVDGNGVSTKIDLYKHSNVSSTKVNVPHKDNSGITTEGEIDRNGLTTNFDKDLEIVCTERGIHSHDSRCTGTEIELNKVQSLTDINVTTNKPMETEFNEGSNKLNTDAQLNKDRSIVPYEADTHTQATGRVSIEEFQHPSHTLDPLPQPEQKHDKDEVDNAHITEFKRQHFLGAFIPSDSEVEMRTSISSLESLNMQLQEALKNKYYASLRYPSSFSGEDSTTDANTDDEYFDPRTLARDPFSPEEEDFTLSWEEEEVGYSSHGTYSAQDSSTDSEVEGIIGIPTKAGTGGLLSKDEWRRSDISLIAEVEPTEDTVCESRESQTTPTPLQDTCIKSSHETGKYPTSDTTPDVPIPVQYKIVNTSQEGGLNSHQDTQHPSSSQDGDISLKYIVRNSSRENGQGKRVSFGGEVIVDTKEDIQIQEQSSTSLGHPDSARKEKLSDVTGEGGGGGGNLLTTAPQSVVPLTPTDSTGALTQPQVASHAGKCVSGRAAAPGHTPFASGLPQWTKPLPSYPVYGTYFVATTTHSTTSQPMGIPGLNGKRLLVKIVKATGVGCEKPVSEAYSVVEMDEPPQKFTTSVVKDTSSPFWDEQFLFDLSGGTLELLFELYDKTNGNFLGLGIVGIEELVATPSQRQIIPLQSRPYENDEVSGSLTVEFLFLDRADLPEHTLRASTTSQSVTPRGDLVTTTTTTYIKAPENQDIVVNGGDSVAAVVLRDIEEKKSVVTNNASKSTMIIHASKKPDLDGQHGYMTDDLLNLTMTPTTTTGTPTITTTGAYTTVTTTTTTTSATHSAPATTTADTSEPVENEERGRSRGNRRKRDSFFGTLKKRFSRSKVRSKSMDPGVRDPSLERDPSVGRSVSMERSSNLNRASAPAHYLYLLHAQRLLSVPASAVGDAGSTRSSLSDASAISSSSTRTYVNEASTLIVETSENGVFKHYLIPLSLQQKSKWRKKGLKLHIFGEHTFVAKHMSSSTQCEVCQKTLGRRFGKQGYICRDCGYKCHKPCHVKTETTCPNSTVNNMDLEYVRDPKEERRAWLKKTNKTA